MNTIESQQTKRIVTAIIGGLWGTTAVLLLLGMTGQAQDPASAMATAGTIIDAAKGKDTEWMALATAMGAIGLSFWLVKQMMIQNARSVEALVKSNTDATAAINQLREDLARSRFTTEAEMKR